MTTQHYYLAPSGAGLTVHCAAAPHLQKQYAEDEAEHPVTREGVAMHWGASEILTGRPVTLNQAAPNGVTLDWELMQATSVYTDDVFDMVGKHPGELHVEQTIHNDALHSTLNGGTPDCWLLHRMPDARIFIVLWDFKGGHGIIEAFENWQLINYAALILKALESDGQDVMFCFRIVQPRAYHPEGAVRSWYANGADLRAQFNQLAAAYAKATPQGTEPAICPPASPGAHCLRQHCSAAGRWCSALHHSNWDMIDFAYASRPHTLSKDAHSMGLVLRIKERALTMLQADVEGMRGEALQMIKNGKSVTFYTTTDGKGREVIDPARVAEFATVGDALGIDVRKPLQCITPLQARDAHMPPDVVAAYTLRKTGERKLVPDDGTEARKVFG